MPPAEIDRRFAALYVRVSTEDQSEAFGPESQRRACRDYAEQNNLQIVAEYEDAISGSTIDRPHFNRLLANTEQFEHIILLNRSRLGRGRGGPYILLDQI